MSSCASAPVTYTDPNVHGTGATLVKEFCVGQGRGLIWFDGLDSITFKKFEIAKIVLAPGPHTVKVIFLAPGTSVFVNDGGDSSIPYEFAANGSYILRYRRTNPDHFKAWIEPIDASSTQAPNSVCLEPAFEDPRYWQ